MRASNDVTSLRSNTRNADLLCRENEKSWQMIGAEQASASVCGERGYIRFYMSCSMQFDL
jgi:predicted amino acid dehydrogenase